MGLLKTAATVAVASSVHGRIQRRQQAPVGGTGPGQCGSCARHRHRQRQHAAPAQPQQAYAEPVPPPQVPAAPAQPTDMSERLAQLKQLGAIYQAGVRPWKASRASPGVS